MAPLGQQVLRENLGCCAVLSQHAPPLPAGQLECRARVPLPLPLWSDLVWSGGSAKILSERWQQCRIGGALDYANAENGAAAGCSDWQANGGAAQAHPNQKEGHYQEDTS